MNKYKHVLYYFRAATGSFATVEFITDDLEENQPKVDPPAGGFKLYSHSTEICGGTDENSN